MLGAVRLAQKPTELFVEWAATVLFQDWDVPTVTTPDGAEKVPFQEPVIVDPLVERTTDHVLGTLLLFTMFNTAQ